MFREMIYHQTQPTFHQFAEKSGPLWGLRFERRDNADKWAFVMLDIIGAPWLLTLVVLSTEALADTKLAPPPPPARPEEPESSTTFSSLSSNHSALSSVPSSVASSWASSRVSQSPLMMSSATLGNQGSPAASSPLAAVVETAMVSGCLCCLLY
jgi:hypothetical protein